MRISEFLLKNGPGYYWIKYKTGPEYRLEGPHWDSKQCSIFENGKKTLDKCRIIWNPKGYRTIIIQYNPASYVDGSNKSYVIEAMSSDGIFFIDSFDDTYGDIGKDLEIAKIPFELHTYENCESIVIDAKDTRNKLKEMNIDIKTLVYSEYLP